MSQNRYDNKHVTVWKKLWVAYICVVLYALLCFVIAGENVDYKTTNTTYIDGISNVGELVDGKVVEQSFSSDNYKITGIGLNIGTYSREELTGTLHVELVDNNEVVSQTTAELSSLKNGEQTFTLDEAVENVSDSYVVRAYVTDTQAGKSVTLMTGETSEQTDVIVDNETIANESLAYSVVGKVSDPLGIGLKGGVGIFLVWLGIYLALLPKKEKEGKNAVGLNIINAWYKYRFLISQLVTRDFKVRYKRSVLGVFWSFINPLLTMSVQFVVFSHLFRTGIDNYIVYLLIGITFFNFYSESTNAGLLSIIDNGSLIKKVYVPKYVYPVSSLFSSSINFFISLILMLLVAFITGITPNRYFLLLPYAILCIFILNLGVSLIISTGMVFFHDVKFLYSVFMTLLSYATPLFWALSMMPQYFINILMANPLMDIILFARSCILEGVFPGSLITILALGIPVCILLLGIWLFNKNQDQFILYI